MLKAFIDLWRIKIKKNVSSKLIYILGLVAFNRLGLGVETELGQNNFNLTVDSDSGLQILGTAYDVSIANNVNLTNPENQVITASEYFTDGAINIGENSNIVATGSNNAIDLSNVRAEGIITINNQGNITVADITQNRAIDFDDSTSRLRLNNHGVINGVINGSAFDDLINNHGIIKGFIFGGGGNDTINFNGGLIAGTIDGGTGSNTLNFNYDFTANDVITGMQTINVNQGTLLINHDINKLDNVFTNFSKVAITSNGAINGDGIIDNKGEFSLNSGGKIGNNSASFQMKELFNQGLFKINASVNDAFRLETINNNPQGNLLINTLESGKVVIGNLHNIEQANLTINNQVDAGINIGTVDNLAGGVINLVNTTGNPADVTLGSFTDNSGSLNLTGAVQIGSHLTNNETGIIKFNSSDAYLELKEGPLINKGTVIVAAPAKMNTDYIAQSNSTHVMYVDSLNQGTLNLTAGSVDFGTYKNNLKIINSSDFVAANSTIKVAQGTLPAVAIEPNNINILSSSAIIKYEVFSQGNEVLAQALRNSYSDVVSNYTPNTMIASKVIDQLRENDGAIAADFKQVLGKIDQASDPMGVTLAIDQIVPDLNASQGTRVNFENLNMVFNLIGNRINHIARLEQDQWGNPHESGYAAGSKWGHKKNYWVKGFGSFNRQNELEESFGYNANTGGFTGGVDYQIKSKLWLGWGLSYARTYVKTKEAVPDRTCINSYQLNGYSSYDANKYYIDSFIAVGFNKYKSNRHIIIAGVDNLAKASFYGVQPGFKVAVGMPQWVNNWKITPNTALQYTYLHQPKYDENGAGGLNLNEVKAKDAHLITGSIGLKVEVPNATKFRQILPDFHISTLYDFINPRQQVRAQFEGGGGSFTLKGDRLGKLSFNVGAGLSYVNTNGVTVVLNYDLNTRKKFIGHNGSLNVKYVI